MKRAACIDIGSNSVLLSVAEASGTWINEIATGERITRLGAGLAREGRLQPANMKATCDTVLEFLDQAKNFRPAAIRLLGTQALRKATNAAEFKEMVYQAAGLDVEIISGEEEARLSFLAADRSLLPDSPKMVFDVGGGSTELISGASSRIEASRSMALGCVSLGEQFPYPGSRGELRAHLERVLTKELRNWPRKDALIGIGGTATTLGAIHLKLTTYDRQKVHGLNLSIDWISGYADELAHMPEADRLAIPYSSPPRLKVLGPGIEIILALMRCLSRKDLMVCDSGLRHAVIYQMVCRGQR